MVDIKGTLNAKTLYLHLVVRIVLALSFVGIVYIFFVPLIYWSLFGEGAASDRISNMPFNILLSNYLALIIGLMLCLAWAYKSVRAKNFSKLKSYLISAFLIIVVYPFKEEIFNFMFYIF